MRNTIALSVGQQSSTTAAQTIIYTRTSLNSERGCTLCIPVMDYQGKSDRESAGPLPRSSSLLEEDELRQNDQPRSHQ